MIAEKSLVFAVAKKVIGEESDCSLDQLLDNDKLDWQKFKDMLSYHGLVPFGCWAMRKQIHLLPQDLRKTLEASYNYYLMHASYLQQRFLELHECFTEEGIDFIPIKGVAILDDLYAQFPIRPSTDIDVLVRDEDLECAGKLLKDCGYDKDLEGLKESYWRKKQYHFVYVEREPSAIPVRVELHWDIDYPRKRKMMLPEMFSRLREFPMQSRPVKLLSPEDTFFTLALHQRRFGVALQLRDVCDMALLIKKYADSFDWDYILKESRRGRFSSTIFFALTQIKTFFDVRIPAYVWKEPNVSLWKRKIITRFIKKNTFSSAKNLYLKCHFLLYDNLWEPIDYILNIPQEQFAKFYGLSAYDKMTEFLYRNRLLYIPFKPLFEAVSKRN